MSLERIDGVLAVWKARLSAIAENLLELQCESTYQSLTGGGGLRKVEITGVTAARAEPALRAMNPLFAQFGALQSTVDRAVELRAKLPALFGADARIRELEALLFAPSIEAEVTEVPLAERDLLTGARHLQRITPEDLLDRMTRTFALVRDTVHEVGEAWNRSGQRAEVAAEKLEVLRAQRALPTSLLLADFERLEQMMREANACAAADPLGAEGLLEGAYEQGLRALRQRVEAAQEIAQRIRTACVRMREFMDVHTQAIAARAAHCGLFVPDGEEIPPVDAEKVDGLQSWLGRLEHRLQEGALEALPVGLSRWSAAVESCLLQDQRCLAMWARGAAQRMELQGRLGALAAKGRARGLAPAMPVAAAQARAERLLRQTPVPLCELVTAVAHLEQVLSSSSVPQVAEAGRGGARP